MFLNPKFWVSVSSPLDDHSKLSEIVKAVKWDQVMATEKSPRAIDLAFLARNQKIVEIGSTEFKLWQLKESPNH